MRDFRQATLRVSQGGVEHGVTRATVGEVSRVGRRRVVDFDATTWLEVAVWIAVGGVRRSGAAAGPTAPVARVRDTEEDVAVEVEVVVLLHEGTKVGIRVVRELVGETVGELADVVDEPGGRLQLLERDGETADNTGSGNGASGATWGRRVARRVVGRRGTVRRRPRVWVRAGRRPWVWGWVRPYG